MIRFLKRNKIFSLLCLFTFISFLFGLFFYAKLDNNSRDVVSNNIYLLIKGENLSLKDFFFNHLFSNIFIWLLGISIIGILFVLFLYFYQVFIFSFEGCALLSTLGFKYILSIFLYLLPSIICSICTFILCFYSIHFSIYLIRYLFLKKQYMFHDIMKRYIKVFLFSFIGLITSTILDGLVIRFISKLFL